MDRPAKNNVAAETARNWLEYLLESPAFAQFLGSTAQQLLAQKHILRAAWRTSSTFPDITLSGVLVADSKEELNKLAATQLVAPPGHKLLALFVAHPPEDVSATKSSLPAPEYLPYLAPVAYLNANAVLGCVGLTGTLKRPGLDLVFVHPNCNRRDAPAERMTHTLLQLHRIDAYNKEEVRTAYGDDILDAAGFTVAHMPIDSLGRLTRDSSIAADLVAKLYPLSSGSTEPAPTT